SMARRLATVSNHAPGLRGTLSTSQRSSALTSASCSASSANSKSPSWLISAARTRPCSSRKVRSIRDAAVIPLPVRLVGRPQRADLYRAVVRKRDLRRPRNRLVEVFAVQQEVAAQLLVCFDERPISDQRLAVAHPDRGGCSGR